MAKEQPTNVVFIIADSLRADGVGCYGNPRVPTPNLDALAERGLRFETAYSTSPLCVPARSQLLTGKYCHETGNLCNPAWQYHVREPVEVDGVFLAPEVPTLPQLLNACDYRTAHLGKSHFSPKHNPMGNAYMEQADFYGRRVYEHDAYYQFLKAHGQAELFRDAFGRVDTWGTGGGGAIREEFGYVDRLCPVVSKLPAELQYTPWLGGRAVEFIGHQPADQPFYLFVSFYAPHDPYCVSPPFDELIDWRSIPLPPIPEQCPPNLRLAGEGHGHDVVLPEAMWKKNIAHYLANVAMIDIEVGRIVRQLKERGLYEQTLIIFTSDHGDTLGEQRHWGKNLMYESCTRIPLIFHHGGGRVATGLTQRIATLLDLMPTILDFTGCELPDTRLVGEALDLGQVQHEADDRVVIGELGNSPKPQYFVRDGNWKAIFHEDQTACELFNLAGDPNELNNLAESESQQAADLRRQLDDWLAAERPHVRPKRDDLAAVDFKEMLRQSHL